ncbi:Cysteine protease [Thalictrum thalictroides]|uniref:Cysteine protease n=1 Tax=Thalictrum thalictroides TaxID=46969 RepID=A0A7J6W6Y2_THATH|nr:Cysteine protease [Thalictrum thalictroides]
MQPFSSEYIEILDLFGDSEASPFSIHTLLQVGRFYGLAPGSWIGPYAMCRSWETLAHSITQQNGKQSLSMVIYVVCGDENGEQGRAPIVYVEDVTKLCTEFSEVQVDWKPIILLVPLVLGFDKVNPRLSMLRELLRGRHFILPLQANVAPLFTITMSREFPKTVAKDLLAHSMDVVGEFIDNVDESEISIHVDDWQFL